MRIVIVTWASAIAPAGGLRQLRHEGLAVVAAENVYGDIARQIGGAARRRDVDPLRPERRPPPLRARDVENGLAVATASVVIQNGVGYDAFMTKLENASPNSKRHVLTIADVLGVHGRDANPHLWYDVPRCRRSHARSRASRAADPAHARRTRTDLARFDASLRAAQARGRARSAHAFGGHAVAYTEPVPGYLLDAAGLATSRQRRSRARSRTAPSRRRRRSLR